MRLDDGITGSKTCVKVIFDLLMRVPVSFKVLSSSMYEDKEFGRGAPISNDDGLLALIHSIFGALIVVVCKLFFAFENANQHVIEQSSRNYIETTIQIFLFML